jgi:hypothetical protein
MIPGVLAPSLFGMDPQTAFSLSPEEYCAKVLASICKAALHYSPDGGCLINYRQLPEVVTESLLNYFDVSYSDEEIARLRAASKRNAKDLTATFQSDSHEKRDKATNAIRDAAEKWLYPIYQELEAARHKQPMLAHS